MNDACEKFIDEISSGASAPSEELVSHMAECPECKKAFDAVTELKHSRKPLNKKETAAIAAVLGLIKAGAGTTAADAAKLTSTATAAGGLTLSGKLIAVFCLAAAVIAAALSFSGSSAEPQDVLSKPLSVEINEINNETGQISEKYDKMSEQRTSETVDKPALAGVSADESSGQTTAGSQKARMKIYSPNQETIDP